MSEFVLIDIDEIKGSEYDFYKLEINGVCPLDDFEESLTNNPQYLSQYHTIFSYAQFYADGLRIPPKKLNTIKLNIDDVSIYEFKSRHLRVYFFHTSDNPDRIIALGGFKNRQKADIRKLSSIIIRYINNNPL